MPARKGAKKAAEKLVAPIVSDAVLAKAKEALKDAGDKKRASSNMMYYLESIGKKNA